MPRLGPVWRTRRRRQAERRRRRCARCSGLLPAPALMTETPAWGGFYYFHRGPPLPHNASMALCLKFARGATLASIHRVAERVASRTVGFRHGLFPETLLPVFGV